MDGESKAKIEDTRTMPDALTLPGHHSTLGEQRALIAKLRGTNEAFYWMLQAHDCGSLCHPFLEFCGLQSKYLDLLEESLWRGIEVGSASKHTGAPLALEAHHVEYLGEKFGCIYGFAFAGSPELRRAFWVAAFGPPDAR